MYFFLLMFQQPSSLGLSKGIWGFLKENDVGDEKTSGVQVLNLMKKIELKE